MAQDLETTNISDLEAELPVAPDSPEAQVNPPGLDNAQLLIELTEKMEMMQAELNKVKMENSKLKSIYTDDQQEQPPE